MNTTLKKIAAGLFSAALLVGGSAALAQEKVLRLTFQNQADHPQGIGSQKFADLVKEKSGGKMAVKLFPGGVLGGDLQTVAALQGGTIDMTSLNAGLLNGLIKEFIVFDLPFLFNNSKEADAIMEGPVGQKMFDRLPEKGLVGLGYFDNGFRNLTNSKRPITKVEDIAGLKIRVVQSPIYIDLFNALGANAVPMPFGELYTALEQKTIDGQENPPRTIEASKLFEVQKYMTLTQHTYNPMAFLISKKVWDKFTPEEKKIIGDAAKEASVFQRNLSREQNQQAIERMKKAGVQVNELTPQDVAKLREKAKPVIDKFVQKDVGEALYKEFTAEIAKVRGSK
ncbi:TRAP transporter substrate-binding protein [Propionivibrio limicola]|uniref:TRAP transporter substrate-binding protein n=1 Tax=Propionivibrio limicola TaxID=167645 RepID=UPI00129121A7|nr:TRAP transporter substrate-binding protein [Propionivibrio limicola]